MPFSPDKKALFNILFSVVSTFYASNSNILFLLVQHFMPPEAPVRNGVLERVDNVKRGRGRPKLTWDESLKRDLKDWNISKEIALDSSTWKLAINVPEP